MTERRSAKLSESFNCRSQNGSEMASQLSLIEEERQHWEGTHREELSSDELDERYFVREVIGRGNFGTVYRAIRRADMEEVAIKEIEMSDSPRHRSEAIEECVLWQAISRTYHPSILPLIEILEVADEEALFLVTEMLSCGVLSDRIVDVEMSEQACRQIMIQLTSAVAHMHEACQVAHLDIKPDNVLCKLADPTMPGCLKLCDFGCSKRFTSLTEPELTAPAGTAHFFAPELARAWLMYDLPGCERLPFAAAPLDCWALGILLYHLLHGCPPFHPNPKDEVVLKVASLSDASQPMPYPSASFDGLSEMAYEFLHGLLTASPTERLSAKAALELPWLQPVSDPELRVKMTAAAPREVAARRAKADGKGLFRAVARRVVFANRLMNLRPGAKEEEPRPMRETVSSFAGAFKQSGRESRGEEHDVALSKLLSKLLRYHAIEQGVPIDTDGWALLSDVLQHVNTQNTLSYVEADVREMIRLNDKQRFELMDSPEGTRIRAKYKVTLAGMASFRRREKEKDGSRERAAGGGDSSRSFRGLGSFLRRGDSGRSIRQEGSFSVRHEESGRSVRAEGSFLARQESRDKERVDTGVLQRADGSKRGGGEGGGGGVVLPPLRGLGKASTSFRSSAASASSEASVGEQSLDLTAHSSPPISRHGSRERHRATPVASLDVDLTRVDPLVHYAAYASSLLFTSTKVYQDGGASAGVLPRLRDKDNSQRGGQLWGAPAPAPAAPNDVGGGAPPHLSA